MGSTMRPDRKACDGPIFDPRPTPAILLDDPLEFILADHYRQRQICHALRTMAAVGAVNQDDAIRITHFLRDELWLHHLDEDEDLFPVLRRRMRSERDLKLGQTLEELTSYHQQSEAAIAQLVTFLLADGSSEMIVVPEAMGRMMLAYAADEHRHLAIENGVVMAIARTRLTRQDRADISRRMKARRGLAD